MNHLKRLFLLRHAEALPAQMGQSDFDRRLSANGKADAIKIGNIILQNYSLPEKILLSPSIRTTETTKALNLFDKTNLISIDAIYDGGPKEYLDILKQNSQFASLLLVGHNPSIFALLQYLASPKSAIQIPQNYPTSGLAIIDFLGPDAHLNHHQGELVAFHHP